MTKNEHQNPSEKKNKWLENMKKIYPWGVTRKPNFEQPSDENDGFQMFGRCPNWFAEAPNWFCRSSEPYLGGKWRWKQSKTSPDKSGAGGGGVVCPEEDPSGGDHRGGATASHAFSPLSGVGGY